ncbi:kinase-like domain-containing protein [Rhizophagus irregularis DAOM 181602=DAOM 197198]|nr:kinase-like domain-containing protein [Rhizophagus irregularis DAOM 181602=DAOM 197198]
MLIEWIPYNNLQNIKYLTEGGCSKIYTANWIENVESANRSWFDEAKSHLTIANKWPVVVSCYAPEVIAGKGYTRASDIYSIAMTMWEVSSGQPPFANYEDDYNLAMDIVNGMRPKIISGTPLKYKELMEQCWDADPTKRPGIYTIRDKIREINRLYYQNVTDKNTSIFIKFLKNFKKTNNLNKLSDLEILSFYYASSKLSISKVYQFENLPEPINATEEEQEAYHSKAYSFNIPENIDDLNKSSDHDNDSTKISSSFKGNSKRLSKAFQKFYIGSRDNNQNNYKRETTIKQEIKKQDGF